jgi:hypothetical protein
MQVEFLVNDSVSLLLSPENEMEEALLKQMLKQKNELTEIRTAVTVLNRTIRNGLLIGKKVAGFVPKDDGLSNESEQETV